MIPETVRPTPLISHDRWLSYEALRVLGAVVNAGESGATVREIACALRFGERRVQEGLTELRAAAKVLPLPKARWRATA